LYGVLEFESFESADYAKKIMQNYEYQGSGKGIRIFHRSSFVISQEIGYQEPKIIPQTIPIYT